MDDKRSRTLLVGGDLSGGDVEASDQSSAIACCSRRLRGDVDGPGAGEVPSTDSLSLLRPERTSSPIILTYDSRRELCSTHCLEC